MPISSSAHLVIVPWLFGWTDPVLNSLSFDVALHLGTLLAVLGFLIISVLMYRRVRGAILIGMVFAAAAGCLLGLGKAPEGVFAMPFVAPYDLSPIAMQLDIPGVLRLSFLPVLLTLFLMSLLDTLGTLVGVGQQAVLIRDGKLPRADRALFADAVGTTVGAGLGTSTITCYIESAAGVSDGARTGLASMVTGLLLLAAMLFSPLASMIGGGVTIGTGASHVTRYPTLAPALIVVGSMMLKVVRQFEWEDPTEYLPAFLILVGIPLTFSIADGIAFGLITYAVAKLATGRWRECPTLTYIFAALFIVQFLIL
jgi:AGZA family xanthine/uracil permease-like MFS transporter